MPTNLRAFFVRPFVHMDGPVSHEYFPLLRLAVRHQLAIVHVLGSSSKIPSASDRSLMPSLQVRSDGASRAVEALSCVKMQARRRCFPCSADEGSMPFSDCDCHVPKPDDLDQSEREREREDESQVQGLDRDRSNMSHLSLLGIGSLGGQRRLLGRAASRKPTAPEPLSW
ncbi:hypothetical protein BDP81DRAFT_427871 [Colletotrichum phormii]|uniref:Uncharacterized protein n=1 Tax=Colletotrichum phormii TaxID=359342 RepID=A0AAI9ZQZ4_9PEZI|nr:uncharacterized protein BDP81DRAFT_427871 [Colletotrichum phormii]KAK1636571.1 hypothetical protein BDP81DRAFT_427871 [Colletotrichum phormii]